MAYKLVVIFNYNFENNHQIKNIHINIILELLL